MKKKITIALATLATITATNITSYYLGSHQVYYIDGEFTAYNTKDMLCGERQLTGCYRDMLHMYYQAYDLNEENLDHYWEEGVMESQAWKRADSILDHDWEDFDARWD